MNEPDTVRRQYPRQLTDITVNDVTFGVNRRVEAESKIDRRIGDSLQATCHRLPRMLHSRPIRSAPCMPARNPRRDPLRHRCRTGGANNCSIFPNPGQSQVRVGRVEICECGEEWSQTNVFRHLPTSLTTRCLGLAMNMLLPTYACSNQSKAFHSLNLPTGMPARCLRMKAGSSLRY